MFEVVEGELWWQNNHISQSKLDLFNKCQLAWWFRYVQKIRKPSKLWLPQGSATHVGVENFLDDLKGDGVKDLTHYLLLMEMYWDENSDLILNKDGVEMTAEEKYRALQDAQHWFRGFYENTHKDPTIGGLDLREVTGTEVEMMRKVDWGDRDGPEIYVRGKIDMVLDLDGPVAKLADLKTSSPNKSYAWTPDKARRKIQATAYGYIVGKPVEFDYIVLPKESRFTKRGNDVKEPAQVVPYRVTTTRNEVDYEMFLNNLHDFVKTVDLENEYAGFRPYATGLIDPKWGNDWCGQLCDYKEECEAKHNGG